jgi:oligopeptidase B
MQRTPPAADPASRPRYAPPQPEERPRKITSAFGERTDPWYWLRNDTRDAPEVLAHLNAENRTCAQWFQPIEDLVDRLKAEHAARVPPEDSSLPVLERGWWYQSRYRAGAEHPLHVRWRDHATAEEILLDAAEAAGDCTAYSLGGIEVSPDNRWLAITEDRIGNLAYALRIIDRLTGATLPESISGIDPDIVFLDDGSLLYIAQDPVTLLGYRVMRHVPGTTAATDQLLYEESDDAYTLSIERSRSGAFVFLHLDSTTTSEVRYLRADASDCSFQVAIPRRHGHEYEIEDWGSLFILRTNAEAPDFRVVEAPIERIADQQTWRELVAEKPGTVITSIVHFAQHLAVGERHLGVGRVRLLDRRTGAESVLDAPSPAATLWLDVNADSLAPFLRYAWGSLSEPATRMALEFETGRTRVLRVDPVEGGHRPEHYAVERRWIVVRDNVTVPVSLLRRIDTLRNGKAPLLITAYGAYGHAQPAVFDRTILPLVDRGFVYAIAHVRGGDDLGKAWYDAGRLLEKHHTFEDFVDVTRALVAAGDVDPARCCALGASAGGLLIGVVANEAAAEYRALVAHVPFVDILTSMLDDELPLTTLEYEEWGNPSADPAAYRYIERYSPYDNLRPRAYPALFATGGLHDSQVQYWESAKWVAKMRRYQTGDAPIMLRVHLDTGHGGATGRYSGHEEIALEQAFLIDLTGAPPQPMSPPGFTRREDDSQSG